MKQFSCDAVLPGCDRTFRGNDLEILASLGAHAETDHGLTRATPEFVAEVLTSLRLAA